MRRPKAGQTDKQNSTFTLLGPSLRHFLVFFFCQFVALCDDLVASHDNTGTDSDALEHVAPCDNLYSTYSGRVLFLPSLPGGVVALCNNLLTPCDNEVEHERGPTPDGGEVTAPEPHSS